MMKMDNSGHRLFFIKCAYMKMVHWWEIPNWTITEHQDLSDALYKIWSTGESGLYQSCVDRGLLSLCL